MLNTLAGVSLHEIRPPGVKRLGLSLREITARGVRLYGVTLCENSHRGSKRAKYDSLAAPSGQTDGFQWQRPAGHRSNFNNGFYRSAGHKRHTIWKSALGDTLCLFSLVVGLCGYRP